jgi:hypothetical protein
MAEFLFLLIYEKCRAAARPTAHGPRPRGGGIREERKRSRRGRKREGEGERAADTEELMTSHVLSGLCHVSACFALPTQRCTCHDRNTS